LLKGPEERGQIPGEKEKRNNNNLLVKEKRVLGKKKFSRESRTKLGLWLSWGGWGGGGGWGVKRVVWCLVKSETRAKALMVGGGGGAMNGTPFWGQGETVLGLPIS